MDHEAGESSVAGSVSAADDVMCAAWVLLVLRSISQWQRRGIEKGTDSIAPRSKVPFREREIVQRGALRISRWTCHPHGY
jgi:hypothetical protein